MNEEVSKVVKVYEDLTKEYEVKALSLKTSMDSIGVNLRHFPPDVQSLVKNMANIGVALNLKDNSDTSYALSWSKLTTETLFLSLERHKLKCVNKKLSNDLQKLHDQKGQLLKETIPKAKQKTTECKIKSQKQKSLLARIKCKNENLSIEVNEIREKAKSLSLDDLLSHNQIVDKSKILNEKDKERQYLRQELSKFHDLPDNLTNAKQALLDMKTQLDEEESKLSKKSHMAFQ